MKYFIDIQIFSTYITSHLVYLYPYKTNRSRHLVWWGLYDRILLCLIIITNREYVDPTDPNRHTEIERQFTSDPELRKVSEEVSVQTDNYDGKQTL